MARTSKGTTKGSAKPAVRRRPARAAMTGAAALVKQLEMLGVEVVFGIPGVHNLPIFDAVRRSSIRTVLVRHEQTCVYAADGYARATGKLGVGITTTGPGAANTAAAMGEARASRSPVLHISTQVETRLLEGRGGRFSLHESPHQRDILDPLCLWSATAARAEAIPSLTQRAAAEALAGRRGPTFIDIPHDLLSQEVRWEVQPPVADRTFAPDARGIERAAEALRKAKRPFIWSGGGAIASDAGELVAKVAEVLDAPVVTTFAGKGILAPDHPLLVGFPPHQPEVTALIRSSDAVLIIGSDLDGMNTQGWRIPFPRPRVAINTIAEDGRRNYSCEVVIESDAREALNALLPFLGAGSSNAAARVSKVRAESLASLRAAKEFVAPLKLVAAIESALPARAFVAADMAIPGYWLAGYHLATEPRSFAYPLGWGTLGFALPAAIGAATTGRPVLAVCGDAGVMYGIGELATAVQEKLPLVTLVVNDGGYGMLRYDERERFGEEFASDLRAPAFLTLAESFGMRAKQCTQRDLSANLKWAFKQKGPVLLELRARFAPPLTTSPRWPLKSAKEARP